MRYKDPALMGRIQDIVNDFFFSEHRMPSVQEIATMAGVAKSTAHRYLVDMDKSGMIDYSPGEMLTHDIYQRLHTRKVEVRGGISCGIPVEENEYVEDCIPLPIDIFGDHEMFILRARGDSMIDAGISSGDYVVIRKQQDAHVGDIVVALVDHTENTLKRLMYDKKRRRKYLHPENEAYEDMYFEQIEIQGVLINVIKNGPF